MRLLFTPPTLAVMRWLNTLLVTAIFISGFLLNSIALMSNAGHNLISRDTVAAAMADRLKQNAIHYD